MNWKTKLTHQLNQTEPQSPITPKEKMVLDFVKSYIKKNSYSPTFQEIKDQFGFASFFSVQRYVKQLSDKGYLKSPGQNKKRAIEIVSAPVAPVAGPRSPAPVPIPLLGRVAAGLPIESLKFDETVEVAPSMLSPGGQYFALQVKGDSMIDDGIMEDDIVIIRKQSDAVNGQTVVALIDNEATIKRFYKKKNTIELHSANPKYKPIIVQQDAQLKIEGTLHGLIRKFKR